MTRAFIEKVLRYRVIDTKQYRYRVSEHDYCTNGNFQRHVTIERLKLEALDTTETINGWETVYRESED